MSIKRPFTDYIVDRLRRRAQKAEAGLARVIAMVRDHADGAAVLDGEGLVRFVNPAAEAILGKSSHDLVGKAFGYPMDLGVSTRLNIVRTGEEKTVFDLAVVAIDIGGEPSFLASMRDVTSQIKAEERERLRSKELEALARIAGILVQPRDLQLKFAEVLEVLTDTVQADFATVRLRDGESLRLVA